jgi:hypothetical protein
MNLDMINNLPNDIIDYIFTLLSPKSKIESYILLTIYLLYYHQKVR